MAQRPRARDYRPIEAAEYFDDGFGECRGLARDDAVDFLNCGPKGRGVAFTVVEPPLTLAELLERRAIQGGTERQKKEQPSVGTAYRERDGVPSEQESTGADAGDSPPPEQARVVVASLCARVPGKGIEEGVGCRLQKR